MPAISRRLRGTRTTLPHFWLLVPIILHASLTGGSSIASGGVNEWTSTGPEGGRVTAVVIGPGNSTEIYVGASGALYASADEAKSWRLRGWIRRGSDILTLTADPAGAALYAVTAGHGVFKSTDRGAHWAPINEGLGIPRNLIVTSFIIDPANVSVFYAATLQGVFKSVDGGKSWRPASSGLGGNRVNTLAIQPRGPSMLYAGTDKGLFRSVNAGESWAALPGGGSYVTALAIDPAAPREVLVGDSSGNVRRILNGDVLGASGRVLGRVGVLAFAFDLADPNTIYVATGGSLLKSSDRGLSWKTVVSLAWGQYVHSVAVDPRQPNRVYAVSDDGVHVSTDRGGTWAAANRGLINTCVVALATDPKSKMIYAGTAGLGVFQSADAGATWNATNEGLEHRRITTLAVDPRNASIVYCGTDNGGISMAADSNGGIYKSLDAGRSWRPSGPMGMGVDAVAIDPSNPSVLYAAAQGIFKSSDGATRWSEVASGERTTAAFAVAIDPKNPMVLYAGAFRGLFKSDNAGKTWRSPLGGVRVRSVAVDPRRPSKLYVGTDGKGVFTSDDGGGMWSTWSGPERGLADSHVNSVLVDPTEPDIVYAGTPTGVFRSVDGGSSWSRFGEGLEQTAVHCLSVHPSGPALHAGTDQGVFRMPLKARP